MAKYDSSEEIDKELTKKTKELYDLATHFNREIFICAEVNQLPLISYNYRDLREFMKKLERGIGEILK